MTDQIKTVNHIIDGLQRYVNSLSPDHEDLDRRADEMEALRSIRDELLELRRVTKPVSKEFGDLSDLPEELLAELSVAKTSDLEDQIYTIINAAGGEANIDMVLVELFRRFKVKQKRRFIQNKLWRMTQKEGVIWSHPDQKGVYVSTEPKPEKPKVMPGMESGENPFDLDDEIPF